MRLLLLFLTAILTVSAAADLDRIDADGVTETGGSSAYARMLPRTKSDGTLDASLLPPVADWASKPIPNLYYVSGAATTQGNGSPQYPFNTFTYAMSHATVGSSVLFAPYSGYDGTMSLAAGNNVTLVGFGRSTCFSSITVSTSGSSTSTELRICGAYVKTLNVSGGKINIRLCGSKVDKLTANASADITVTRTDMGSYVSASTVSYTDAYTGYSTAPKAMELIGGTKSMVFSGDRAVVGTETVAYVSEIAAATNAVYVTIDDLRGEDARIEGLVEDEAEAREEADDGLAASIADTDSALREEIANIGTTWGTQISTLSTSISKLGTSLDKLYAQETNDINAVNAELAKKATITYVDSTASTLRTEMSNGLDELRSDVPGIANTCADNRIEVAKPTIISEAVKQAGTAADAKVAPVAARVTTLESGLVTANANIANNASNIKSLNTGLDTVNADLAAFKTTESEDIAAVNTSIETAKTTIRAEYKAADTALESSMTSKLSSYALKSEVNSMADARALIQINNQKASIVSTATGEANTYTDGKIATVNATIESLRTDTIAPLATTVGTHTDSISAHKTKINEIITCLQAIKDGKSWSVPTKL